MGQKKPDRLQALQEVDTTEEGGVVEGTLPVFSQSAFVLFDTGATHSFISQAFADALNEKPASMTFELPFTTPLGEKGSIE